MSKVSDFEFGGQQMSDVFTFDDRLELVGFGLGVLLILIGIATILGQPWTIKSIVPALLQIVGSLGAIAIGGVLIWLTNL
jgi:hypothetical protein